jgi:hypothetical protein
MKICLVVLELHVNTQIHMVKLIGVFTMTLLKCFEDEVFFMYLEILSCLSTKELIVFSISSGLEMSTCTETFLLLTCYVLLFDSE